MSKIYIIVGSGPTSLGFAWKCFELGLFKNRDRVLIFERSKNPGGLGQTFTDSKGFLYDQGGHVLFSHSSYFDSVLDFCVGKHNFNHLRRKSYMFLDTVTDISTKTKDVNIKQFIKYPIQNNIQSFSRENFKECLNDLILQQKINKPQVNFDDWIVKNFGESLAKILRVYNKKVWTVEPNKMNSDWIKERVACPDINKLMEKAKKMSLFQDSVSTISSSSSSSTNESVEKRYMKETKDEDDSWGPNQMFRFPKQGGTGSIWRSVYEKLPKSWFYFNHEVIEVNPRKKCLKVKDMKRNITSTIKYDFLINTGPMDLLISDLLVDNFPSSSNILTDIKPLAKEFVHNKVYIMGIGLSGEPPSFLKTMCWMYFPDPDSPFYRATVFSNYSKNHCPPGKYWSLMCEYASKPDVNINTDELIEKTIQAFIRYKFIINEEQVVSRYTKTLNYGYPVPFLNREEVLNKVNPFLEKYNIYSRGRFGGWRYEVANQDHSFMQGVELAEYLICGNTEEYYTKPNLVNSRKKTPENLQRISYLVKRNRLSFLPKFEFVIAQYKENLSWLNNYEDFCTIYCKNPDATIETKYWRWKSLPNVGRESHTILYHIINNYDTLSEITVFLQGNINDHPGDIYNNPFDYLTRINKNNQMIYQKTDPFQDWGKIKHWVINKKLLKNGQMKRAEFTMGEFWEEIFGKKHPDFICVSYAGCFAVHRDLIRRRPLKFWKKLISYLDDHSNPEIGHYFERLWVSIFTC